MVDLVTYTPIISYSGNSFLCYIYQYFRHYWIYFHAICMRHVVFKFSKMIGYTFKHQAVTIGTQDAQFTICNFEFGQIIVKIVPL